MRQSCLRTTSERPKPRSDCLPMPRITPTHFSMGMPYITRTSPWERSRWHATIRQRSRTPAGRRRGPRLATTQHIWARFRARIPIALHGAESAVVDYIDGCKQFWESGASRLAKWTLAIERGGNTRLLKALNDVNPCRHREGARRRQPWNPMHRRHRGLERLDTRAARTDRHTHIWTRSSR